MVLAVAFSLAVGLNVLLGPYLREAVTLAVWYVPDRGMLIPLCYRMVGPLFFGIWLVMLNRWMLRRWPHLRDTSDKSLLSRIGSPDYIEHLAAIGVDAIEAHRLNHSWRAQSGAG